MSVDTPLATHAPAPAIRRVGAAAIDGALVGVVASLAYLPLMLSLGSGQAEPIDVIRWSGIGAVVALTAWTVMVYLKGTRTTPGMALMNTRLVMEATGGHAGFGRALLRAVVWQLSCSVVVGAFSPLLDERLRGWHDKALGTMMIDDLAPERGEHSPTQAHTPPPPPPPSSRPAAPAPPAPSPEEPDESGVITAIPGYHRPEAAAPTAPPAPEAPSLPEASAAPPPPEPPPAPEVPPAPKPLAPESSLAPEPSPVSDASAPDTDDVIQEDDDLDATRIVGTRTSVAILTWDDGTVTTISRPSVFGRNPAPVKDGDAMVSVADQTRSLSKTHFYATVGATTLTLVDLNSTNGLAVVRDGSTTVLTPQEGFETQAGDVLIIGQRHATISWSVA